VKMENSMEKMVMEKRKVERKAHKNLEIVI